MTQHDALERLLASTLRDGVDAGASPSLQAEVNAIPTSVPLAARRPWRRWFPLPEYRALAIAVVLAIAAVGIGAALMTWRNVGSAPTVPPAPTIRPAGVPVWNPDSASQDWPGPVRQEPAGRAENLRSVRYADPRGDVSVDVVDLLSVQSRLGCWRSLTTERCAFFNLADNVPSIPDPRDDWIAYGIVVDYTGDGIGDVRYGVDNAPESNHSDDWGDHLRIWRADLATRTTDVWKCCEALIDAVFPNPGERGAGSHGSIFVPQQSGESTFRFYAWASSISNGQIVTDYAPDTGWISMPSSPAH